MVYYVERSILASDSVPPMPKMTDLFLQMQWQDDGLVAPPPNPDEAAPLSPSSSRQPPMEIPIGAAASSAVPAVVEAADAAAAPTTTGVGEAVAAADAPLEHCSPLSEDEDDVCDPSAGSSQQKGKGVSSSPAAPADSHDGGGRGYEPWREGRLGGRQRFGISGGSNRQYYAGLYAAKGQGRMKQCVAEHGLPPGRGGVAFHQRKF